jgi:hypothetical protein
MAKQRRSKHLEALFTRLQEDWKGPYRKFPDQTIYALDDDRVAAALEKRLDEKGGIKDIRSLEYNFLTGLHYLIFEFEPCAPGPEAADALLAILDSTCKVLAVVDPFDPVQPNKFVPPLPKESEQQPFVLERPSPATRVAFSEEAVYPVQVRSRAFFQRLRAGPNVIPWPDLDPIIHTWCQFNTWTPYGTVVDYIPDDCDSGSILA